MGSDHRAVLASQLRNLDFLEREVGELSDEVAERMCPFEDSVECIDAIPGIGRRIAEEVLAETGFARDRFPTAAHLASWARVCPGNNESAGKRKSGRTGSEIHGFARLWLRQPGLLPIPRAPTYLPSTIGWQPVGVQSGRYWLWLVLSW